MDNKIRAAAENDQPVFEEKAWQKMEAALNEHLPQKDKKRRIIFFFLFALLLGIPAFFIIRNISSDDTASVTTQQTSPQSGESTTAPATNSSSGTQSVKDNKPSTPSSAAVNESEKTTIISTTTTPAAPDNNRSEPVLTQQHITTAPGKKPLTKTATANSNNSFDMSVTNPGTSRKKTTTPANNSITTDNQKPVTVTNNTPVQNTQTDPSASATITATDPSLPDKAKTNPVSTEATTTKEATTSLVKNDKTDSTAVAITTKKPSKKHESFAGKIGFSLSGGADLSSVGIDNPGKVKSAIGVGISYEISKRLTVRTGFYWGKKIYTADSSSYKNAYTRTPGPYPYVLQSINADCYVYEVPVNLVYNFKQVKKHNWFVSAGLSSYFMKKEDYVFNYIKENSNDKQSYAYSYENQNKHYFSVLGLSGGYQYHFNNRLSFMAEPYIKAPIAGIGFGKVKLNSAGMLFTVSYKPFKK